MMKVGILTSSRADFGVYLPLLKAMKEDVSFEIELIVFGTHLSRFHGYTLDEIKQQGFKVKYHISSMILADDPSSIATAYGLTSLKFASFWQLHQEDFHWVLCLGDRYEMAAAVAAGIPFGIQFAHLFGGETTLGAIDNIYRHSITLASKLHFVSTETYAKRVEELNGPNSPCHVVGSLSLESVKNVKLLTKDEFIVRWKIDMSVSSILITIHPETVDFVQNEYFADESYKALLEISKKYQLIITMPNADTQGSYFRKKFIELNNLLPGKIFLIENFGTQSYFTCMKYACLLLGNTSSGIVEAASFNKYVINIGDRQKGRLVSENVIHVPFVAELIVEAVKYNAGKNFVGKNIYFKESPSQQIINILKST